MKLTNLSIVINLTMVVLYGALSCVESFLSRPSYLIASRSQVSQNTLKDLNEMNSEGAFIPKQIGKAESLEESGGKSAIHASEAVDINHEFQVMAENLEVLKEREEELTKMLDEAAQELEVQTLFQSLKKRYNFQRSLLQTRLQRELKARQSLSLDNNQEIGIKTIADRATRPTTEGASSLDIDCVVDSSSNENESSEMEKKDVNINILSTDDSFKIHRRLLEARLKMEKKSNQGIESVTSGKEWKSLAVSVSSGAVNLDQTNISSNGPNCSVDKALDKAGKKTDGIASKPLTNNSYKVHKRLLEARLRMENKLAPEGFVATTVEKTRESLEDEKTYADISVLSGCVNLSQASISSKDGNNLEETKLDSSPMINTITVDETERIITDSASKIPCADSYKLHERLLEARLRMEKKSSQVEAGVSFSGKETRKPAEDEEARPVSSVSSRVSNRGHANVPSNELEGSPATKTIAADEPEKIMNSGANNISSNNSLTIHWSLLEARLVLKEKLCQATQILEDLIHGFQKGNVENSIGETEKGQLSGFSSTEYETQDNTILRKKKESYWNTVSSTEISEKIIRTFTPDKGVLCLIQKNETEILGFAASRMVEGAFDGVRALWLGLRTIRGEDTGLKALSATADSAQNFISVLSAVTALSLKEGERIQKFAEKELEKRENAVEVELERKDLMEAAEARLEELKIKIEAKKKFVVASKGKQPIESPFTEKDKLERELIFEVKKDLQQTRLEELELNVKVGKRLVMASEDVPVKETSFTGPRTLEKFPFFADTKSLQ